MIRTVLLTGGSGFIGSHLLEELILKNYNVILLKRSYTNTDKISQCLNKVKVYDIDKSDLEEIFANNQIDIIVHLATYFKKTHVYSDIEDMFYSNITFPVKLLDCAGKYKVRYFINTGTFAEYSTDIIPINEDIASYIPENLYARTKIAFEECLYDYTKKFDLKSLTLKIYSPYGPRDMELKVIPYIITNAIKDNDIKLSAGYQKLDFIYVKDIVGAYIKAIEHIENIQDNFVKLNIGTGIPHSIRDIVDKIEKIFNRTIKKNFNTTVINTTEVYADISKAERIIEWKPKYSLLEGVQETIEFYKNNL